MSSFSSHNNLFLVSTIYRKAIWLKELQVLIEEKLKIIRNLQQLFSIIYRLFILKKTMKMFIEKFTYFIYIVGWGIAGWYSPVFTIPKF